MTEYLEVAIDEKLEKENKSRDDYKAETQKNDRLIKVIEEGYTSISDADLAGFSEEEVKQAAIYTLKGRMYDMNVSSMNIGDSPIYYDQDTKKSRWFWRRKKLNEKAKIIISQAENYVAGQLEAERKKNEVYSRINNVVEGVDFSGIGEVENISEQDYRDDDSYMEELTVNATGKCVDRLLSNQHITDSTQNVLEKSADKNSFYKDELALKTQVDEVEKTLDKEMVSGADIKVEIISKVKESLSRELRNIYDSVQSLSDATIEKVTKEHIDGAKRLIKKMDGLYKEVAAGKLSPEVLKVFLRSDLMAYKTKAEIPIYDSMVYEEGNRIPSDEERDDYKETLVDLSRSRRKDGMQGAFFQKIGGPSKLLEKKGLRSIYQTTDLDELEEVAIKKNRNFIHFYPKGKISMDKIVTRYYVTAKKGAHTKLITAWMKALDNKPKIAEKLYFKVIGDINLKKKDNIVLYVTEDNNKEELDEFFKEFYNLCGGEQGDILESNEKVIASTTPVDKMNGITVATEFDTDRIYNDTIRYGLFTDMMTDRRLRYLTKESSPNAKKPAFSYNEYVAKALLYSAVILGKKEGIDRREIIKKVSEDAQLKKKFIKYFADFMKLGGTDTGTMLRDKQ
ncbi:MAG: hypothetical protein J6N76_08125 [Lachnospiraceae bacterium]|nr:hypothetical protein [Lachnospiraceae bacterium]